jgi:hypothetical protein
MAARIALGSAAPGQLPVMIWVRQWDEYLVAAAGGTSVDSKGSEWDRRPASFCPWCGSALPRSKRTEWHLALNALGFDDPGNDDIPARFNTDEWWR